MLAAREIDEACDLLLQRLAGRDPDPDRALRDLLAHLSATRPLAPALSPVLPLSMSAAALEVMLNGDDVARTVAATWRLTALLATEVLGLEAEGHPPTVAALWARMQAMG